MSYTLIQTDPAIPQRYAAYDAQGQRLGYVWLQPGGASMVFADPEHQAALVDACRRLLGPRL